MRRNGGRPRLVLIAIACLVLPPTAQTASPYRLVVANWSSRAIREIFVSPATAPDWGGNRLEGRSLSPGDDVRLAYGGACRGDLRVVFDNGSAEERHGLDLCVHGFIGVRPGWTTDDDVAGQMPPGLVTVRNRSGRTITSLYLFADSAADHGRDVLGREVLSDAGDLGVLLPRAGTCDFTLRAVFDAAGGEERRSKLDLCRLRQITIEPRASAR